MFCIASIVMGIAVERCNAQRKLDSSENNLMVLAEYNPGCVCGQIHQWLTSDPITQFTLCVHWKRCRNAVLYLRTQAVKVKTLMFCYSEIFHHLTSICVVQRRGVVEERLLYKEKTRIWRIKHGCKGKTNSETGRSKTSVTATHWIERLYLGPQSHYHNENTALDKSPK